LTETDSLIHFFHELYITAGTEKLHVFMRLPDFGLPASVVPIFSCRSTKPIQSGI